MKVIYMSEESDPVLLEDSRMGVATVASMVVFLITIAASGTWAWADLGNDVDSVSQSVKELSTAVKANSEAIQAVVEERQREREEELEADVQARDMMIEELQRRIDELEEG